MIYFIINSSSQFNILKLNDFDLLKQNVFDLFDASFGWHDLYQIEHNEQLFKLYQNQVDKGTYNLWQNHAFGIITWCKCKKISEENSNNSKNLIKSFHSILLYGFVKAKSSFHKLKNLFRSILKSILRYLKLSLSK